MLERFYHFLTIPDFPPRKCDFIIVLSYALKSKSELTPMTRACCDLAFKLHSRFPESKIIMSTGDNQSLGIPNSLVMVRYARSQNIAGRSLISESRSQNTFENIKYSLKLLKKLTRKKNPHITLVAYDLHMRRAVATSRKLKVDNLSWVSATSKVGQAYGYKGILQTRNRFTVFLYDILAIIFSKIRGWI